MEAFSQSRLPLSHMRTLNRCRIYLKVITLSDITTADSTRIIPSVKKGYQIPARISTLMWPNQGKPNSAEWKIWEASLSHFESRGKLLRPLGRWLHHSHQIWQQTIHLGTGIIYDQQTDPPKQYQPIVRSTRSLRSGQWYDFHQGRDAASISRDLVPFLLFITR